MAGLVMIVVTFWQTARFAFPYYAHTYPFAWYGLIIFLDGLLWWVWNDGIIFRKPRAFVTLLFWSAIFWFFFEICNLRLQNWYYAGVPPQGLRAHLEAYLDFATVLPGIFLVYRLLCCLSIPRHVKTRFKLSQKLRRYWVATGILMLITVMVFPALFFPFVWGALIFLLEPLCARYQSTSLLRQAERGDWTNLVRLLLAGLMCGGYWEFWNYWSLEKWIYTVPFFSEGKLFEMPYLGFLGFPLFAVQCFVMTNCVFFVRGGEHWNPQTRGRKETPPFYKVAYTAMIVLGLLMSEFSYSHMEQHTIDSRLHSIEQTLEDISPDDAHKLAKKGWRYPTQILRQWAQASQSIAVPFRLPIRQRLELAALLQMGPANARLLERAGVSTREKLAQQDPDKLFAMLDRINQAVRIRQSPLVKRRIVAWINGAKRKTALY